MVVLCSRLPCCKADVCVDCDEWAQSCDCPCCDTKITNGWAQSCQPKQEMAGKEKENNIYVEC